MRQCGVVVSVAAVVSVVAGAGCGGGSSSPSDAAHDTLPIDAAVDAPDAKIFMDALPDAGGVCNPLTQQGCNPGDKCTWLVDATSPQYVGHVGCAPSGAAQVGDPCMYGAPGVTGFDDCAKGLVCSAYLGSGVGTCKTICDQQGGSPACGNDRVCVSYHQLFETGEFSPAAAGVCDPACHPLDDNDFDGAGPLTRPGTTCGADSVGCYGYPSFGTPPVSAFSCTFDSGQGRRHRDQVPGPPIFVNSCSQGYLPLLRESSFVSTAVCVAMCKPKNCYAGNCGSDDLDRLGEAPHRCSAVDAVGTFDTSLGGEHCTFLWWFEVDTQNNFLPSAWSDTVGFCYDHSKYLYDSDGNGVVDTQLPPCALLGPGIGNKNDPSDPLTYFGAAELGCVDSATAGISATGKTPTSSASELRMLYRPPGTHRP